MQVRFWCDTIEETIVLKFLNEIIDMGRCTSKSQIDSKVFKYRWLFLSGLYNFAPFSCSNDV